MELSELFLKQQFEEIANYASKSQKEVNDDLLNGEIDYPTATGTLQADLEYIRIMCSSLIKTYFKEV